MAECREIADRTDILQTGRVLMQGAAADFSTNQTCARSMSGFTLT
jgi:branched-chain amino acid transport system ATP-binding protein